MIKSFRIYPSIFQFLLKSVTSIFLHLVYFALLRNKMHVNRRITVLPIT